MYATTLAGTRHAFPDLKGELRVWLLADRGFHHRWPAARLRGCGNRDQPCRGRRRDPDLLLLQLMDELRERNAIPTQSCVLAHLTNTLAAIERHRRAPRPERT